MARTPPEQHQEPVGPAQDKNRHSDLDWLRSGRLALATSVFTLGLQTAYVAYDARNEMQVLREYDKAMVESALRYSALDDEYTRLEQQHRELQTIVDTTLAQLKELKKNIHWDDAVKGASRASQVTGKKP